MAALDVFPFRLSLRPQFVEGPRYETTTIDHSGGAQSTRAEYDADFLFSAGFSVKLPQTATGLDVSDWLDFVEGVRGAADPWLYLAATQRYRELRGTSIGTGTGSAVSFSLPVRYVKASSVAVYVDDVAQASGWSLSGNSLEIGATPSIVFVSAPSNGADVTVDLDFYIPVRFVVDPPEPTWLGCASSDTTRACRVDGVSIREIHPGARLA